MPETSRCRPWFSPRGLPRKLVVTLLGIDYLPWERYDGEAGDRGLVGPDSPVWRVLADELSAFVGGVSGVMVGALHPVVLGGTMEHTELKNDPLGRFARTAGFVRATAFSPTDVAERVIDIVNRMHVPIVGEIDGRRYAASDPDLILWTHVTVWGGFLDGFQRFNLLPLTEKEVDEYWSDIAPIAEKLGGIGAPRSAAEAAEFLESTRPVLAHTPDQLQASRDEIAWLGEAGRRDGWVVTSVRDRAGRWAFGGRGVFRPLGWLVGWAFTLPAWIIAMLLVQDARDMLPPWAREKLGIAEPGYWASSVRLSLARMTFWIVRVATGRPDHVLRARRRVRRRQATLA